MTYINSVPSRQWLASSMLVKGALDNQTPLAPSYFSPADVAFSDTTLGGNMVINPPPQWTRSADIKRRGRSPYKTGQGRSYHEQIELNSQVLTCRFGVATFNALTVFSSNFYHADMGSIARTGRGTGVMYGLGSAAGFVVNIMAWKLMAMQIIGRGFAFFTEKGSSRFYRLKPAMPIYWQTVQTVLNQMLVNLGVSPRSINNTQISHGVNKGYVFTQSDMDMLRAAFPGLFTRSGAIDVWMVSTRYQRLAQNQLIKQENYYDKFLDAASMRQTMQALYFDPIEHKQPNYNSYADYLQAWINSDAGRPVGVQADKDGNVTGTAAETIDQITNPGGLKQMLDLYEAELADGSHFVNFRVNYTGAISETVTNQRGESKLGADLNDYTSKAREFTFKLAGGNIAPGMGEILSSLGQFVTGVSSQFGLDGVLNAAVGGAFIDIPQQWKGSMMDLPRSTYTIDLVSPYNHPMAKLIYQYVPMAMLMAAAFPRSTGKQSYYAPPLMEYFDQGRAQSRLAMFDSLTFERGFTNLGFNHANRAMGIRATFTIADMNNIVHVPITMTNSFTSIILGTLVGGGIGAATSIANEISQQVFDDDTAFNDYLAVITGMNVADQIYTMRKAKLNATRLLLNWETLTSPARMTSILGDLAPSRILSALFYPEAIVTAGR